MDENYGVARFETDRLIIENNIIRRTFDWNGGDLITRSLEDPFSGKVWVSQLTSPDLVFPGSEEQSVEEGSLTTCIVPDSTVGFGHLEATVTFRRGELWIRRVFSIFSGVAAIRCELYLKGRAEGPWYPPATNAAELVNMESLSEVSPAAFAPVLDTISINKAHLQCRAVEFLDVTDRNNNLVLPVDLRPYRSAAPLRGNVLLMRDDLNERGLFVLKEAPCSSVQLAYPGYDFDVDVNRLRVVGPGVRPTDLKSDAWTRAYGWVVGVADASEEALLLSMRVYQATLRRMLPERDEMVLVNTWGDRSQDRRLCERFVLEEIEALTHLGVTTLQLDDGWQNGRTSNSAQAGGSVENIWSRDDFWSVHSERFPNGLQPVLDAAAAKGIKIALWYAPSRTRDFADWEKDAAQLIRLWKEFGVHTFKIDMVKLPTKQADLHLRAMFDRVLAESDGAISFNLDATANRRFGYHDATSYGNIFLENRYTDWMNYYPTWTLRNLWMLSRYVPPQRLQIECLNTWRNADKYPADDPLAPAKVGFPFAVAVTLAAQPLLWFESSSLPPEAFGMADELRTYREHQSALHANPVMPIGEEPGGSAWTGFQSIGPADGYLLFYREQTGRDRFACKLWNVEPGTRLTLTPLIGYGAATTCIANPDGAIEIELPTPWSYALYRYVVAGTPQR